MPGRICECNYEIEDEFEDHSCSLCGEPCCPYCEWQQNFQVFCHRCALMELDIESEEDYEMGYGRRYHAFPCSQCGKLVREDPEENENRLCEECQGF
jgi:hypothetical protein